MRRKPLNLELPEQEKGLPEVLIKAREAIPELLSRPGIEWYGKRIKITYRQRMEAFQLVLGALVERTQLGLGGGVFEIYQDLDGATVYRAMNVDDICRMTGLSRPSFYRAWKVLKDMGYVTATIQEKRFVAPGEYIVSDVIRSLTEKFWEEIGVGVEAFKDSCARLSKKAQQLLQNGIDAAKRIANNVKDVVEGCKARIEKGWKRVYESPELADAAKAQEDLSRLRNFLGRKAAQCWQEKEARGEDKFKCFGCDKSWSKWCQFCLNEQKPNRQNDALFSFMHHE